MTLLAEDASYLLIGLGVAALACLAALKITQQGKFLIWALGLVVLAGVVFGIEHFWVTDAERVEAVVYDMADAVEHSDIDRIRLHFDEKVTIGSGTRTRDGLIPLAFVFSRLKNCHFDFVKITRLTTSVGSQTRMGKAEFKATASGTYQESGNEYPIGSLGTEWALSFRETAPQVWKVTRIQAIKIPAQIEREMSGR